MSTKNTLPKYEDIFKQMARGVINSYNGASPNTVPSVDNGVTLKPVNTVDTEKSVDAGSTLPMTYEEYILSIKSNADNMYKQQIADAELQRQKEVIAANNAYNSSRVNSGANAAALSAMGLSRSGYSDYLESQAYAQKQGAANLAYQNKQSAINQAQSIKNNAYQQADGLYADYLGQQEVNKNNAYANIYSNLGTYSLNDIERLGATMGLEQTDIDALKSAKNELTYASLLGSEYGQKTLDNLVGTGNLYADSPEYNALKNDMIKIDASDLPNMFKNQSYDVSKSSLERLKPLVDDATYAELEKQFNADFGVTTNGVTLKQGTILKKNAGKDGRAISVKKGEDKYTVTYSGGKLGGELKKAADAQNISNNEVFKLGGKLYIKIDGTYYGLDKASLTNKGDYDKLMKLFN